MEVKTAEPVTTKLSIAAMLRKFFADLREKRERKEEADLEAIRHALH